MSEKFYALLLRLFPSRFREAYGEDALQLVRDRLRDETGLFARLGLWADLLWDLALSVPPSHRSFEPELVAAAAQHRLDGVPSFHVLADGTPRPAALLFGAILSLIAVAVFWISLNHPGNYVAIGESLFGEFQSAGVAEQPPPPEPAQTSERATAREIVPNLKLDAAQRRRVIDAAIANLKQHYVDPGVAEKMAVALLAHERKGDDDGATDGQALANLLTRQMDEISRDEHLVLVYSATELPAGLPAPAAKWMATYRREMQQQNCTFQTVKILPHDIAYLKLDSFPDPAVCAPTARSAMASVNDAGAIIFDLRDNRGGDPEMVKLIASYLFDHPEYFYNPRENATRASWTASPVPGNKLADKPAYILTSAFTYSGAEQFCYDLKMLKRATLIGETTGGGAHAGVWHRIDDHFGMGIPEVKPINPYADSDWQTTGVAPDVKVKAAEALESAEQLALAKIQKP